MPRVKALKAFSINEPNAIIHGDPDNSDEKAQWPEVPDHRIAELVERGMIDPDATPPKSRKPKVTPATGGDDGDGAPVD